MTTDNLPAHRAPVAVDLSGPLTDMAQALQLADTLSRSELVPRALAGKPASVFHVLMTGQALGLHWTESVRVIYSAGPGQIGLRGGFLLSQLRKAKHKYTITEDADSATFTLVRGDTEEKFEATFTVEDAIRGGLLKRAANGDLVAFSRDNKPLPWMAWTKRMLRWRAVSDCVSFGAPEVALGFEIEGAEAAPEPEVVLKPQSGGPAHAPHDSQASYGGPASDPAPPEPDARQAATGDSQAAQAQLAELNAQYVLPDADAVHGDMVVGEQLADAMAADTPAEPSVGGNPADPLSVPPDMGGISQSESEPVTDAGDRAELERKVAGQFETLGWHPKRHRTSMLNACTMFAGRRIRSVRDLSPAELARLSLRLSAIEKDAPPEAYPVALADAVEGWREKFAETDPNGYERLEKQ